MPKLYGSYRSRATRNFWLAHEIGLTLELVPVLQAYRLADPQAADAPLNTRSAAFLALSPAGAIPLLEDEGLLLTESLVINLHLARKYGGALGPQDLSESALMEQWTLYAQSSVEAASLAIQYIYGENRADTPAGAAELQRHLTALRRPCAVLETYLATHPYLVGGRFTVADINMAEVLRYSQAHSPLAAEFPTLFSWLKTQQSRPAFQQMWAAREAEPV
jgi:glutathione S-transferase